MDIPELKEAIRTIPDFPKKGIMFRDITTLLLKPESLRRVIEEFKKRLEGKQVDAVAGIESRGFIFGAILAHELGVKFIPIRKKGKIPAEVERVEYELEYGKDAIEVHKDAIARGDRVVVVDDLVATGGTAKAAVELIEKMGGELADVLFVVNLPDLHGTDRLKKAFWLVEFEGE